MSAKTLAVSLVIGAAIGNRFFSSFDSAQKRAVKLGNALKETNKKLDASKQVINYQRQLKTLQQFQGNLGQSSDKMKRRIAEVGLKLEEAKRKARGYGLSIGDIVREEKKLSLESKRLEANLGRLNKAGLAKQRLRAIKGRAFGAAGVAFGASRVIGNAFAVEQQTIRLKTVINSKNSAEDIKKSIAHSIDFAQHSLATQGQVLDIEYSLNSAGLDASAARAGSEIVSKLATVTHGVSEEVGVIVGDSFQNFQSQMTGTTKEKLDRVGNILLKTQEKFSIKNFGQLGESIKEGASAAIGAKIPFEQMAAAVGQLNSAGLKGAQAGTSFKALVGQMILKQDKLGISIVKTANGSTDFIATMKQLKTRMKDVGGATEQLAFLQSALGQQGADAAILLLNNMDNLSTGYDFVASKNDKLSEDYKLFTGSASGQWTMLTQNIEILGTTLAGTLLPAINAVLSPIGDFARWLGSAAQKYPILGKAIGFISLGFIGYAAVLTGVVATQWAYNSAAIAASNSIITSSAALLWNKSILIGGAIATKAVTAAQWLWNAALTANPIGLVIAGVVAFGALAVTVFKNWQPIMDWFKVKFAWLGKSINWVKGIGGFFGAGDGQAVSKPRAGNGKAAAVIAATLATAPAAGAQGQQNQINNTIHITQQAGEDGEQLAKRIADLQHEQLMRLEQDVR